VSDGRQTYTGPRGTGCSLGWLVGPPRLTVKSPKIPCSWPLPGDDRFLLTAPVVEKPQATGVAISADVGGFGQTLSGLMTRVIACINATLSRMSTLELSSTTSVIACVGR
jgi:hypothetical protein